MEFVKWVAICISAILSVMKISSWIDQWVDSKHNLTDQQKGILKYLKISKSGWIVHKCNSTDGKHLQATGYSQKFKGSHPAHLESDLFLLVKLRLLIACGETGRGKPKYCLNTTAKYVKSI